MPRIDYKYRVTYADGRTRNCPEMSSMTCELTDEEFFQIVQGVADDLSLMEIENIDDVIERMKVNVKKYDSYVNLNGTRRKQSLKRPRDITDVELFLEERFINHVLSFEDPVAEMKRPEQIMTVYRTDGSNVEIHYRRGEIMYKDSRKKDQMCSMSADTFLSWFVH